MKGLQTKDKSSRLQCCAAGLGVLGHLRPELLGVGPERGLQQALGAEGRAHRAVHQRLQRAEVVHHPLLLLPVRREQQHPKGLQLGNQKWATRVTSQ